MARMHKGRRVSVVIPCLNEEEGLGKVISSIPDFVDEVLVVDNGSVDRSVEVATSLGAKVISEERRGYGRAYRTGFAQATGEIIATADGDGTYPIHLLEELLEEFDERQLDFASACRFPLQDKDAMSFRNRAGNRVFTLCARLLFSMDVKDVLSGMWVFKQEVLSKMALDCDGWSFSQNIKIEAHRAAGVKFGEIKIPYEARMGEAKLPAWRAGVTALLEMFNKRFSAKTQKSAREVRDA